MTEAIDILEGIVRCLKKHGALTDEEVPLYGAKIFELRYKKAQDEQEDLIKDIQRLQQVKDIIKNSDNPEQLNKFLKIEEDSRRCKESLSAVREELRINKSALKECQKKVITKKEKVEERIQELKDEYEKQKKRQEAKKKKQEKGVKERVKTTLVGRGLEEQEREQMAEHMAAIFAELQPAAKEKAAKIARDRAKASGKKEEEEVQEEEEEIPPPSEEQEKTLEELEAEFRAQAEQEYEFKSENAELVELQEENERLRRKLRHCTPETIEHYAKCKKERAKLRAYISRLEINNADLERDNTRLQELETSYARLRRVLKNRSTKFQELRTKYNELESENYNLRQTIRLFAPDFVGDIDV